MIIYGIITFIAMKFITLKVKCHIYLFWINLPENQLSFSLMSGELNSVCKIQCEKKSEENESLFDFFSYYFF